MISLRSSSFHKISCDNKPNIVTKFIWFFINYIMNNLLPMFSIDKSLELGFFYNKHINKILPEIKNNGSPSRIMSDLFWQGLPNEEIITELKELNVLDLGCGKGVYYPILKKIFGEKLKSYTGLDKIIDKPLLTENLSNKKFVQDDIINVHKYLNNKNLIISQSFIEHIDYDIDLFRDLSEVEKKNHPVLQIHLFPSKECLFSYLFHGIRQYSIKSTSFLTKNFDSKVTKKTLIGLGSKNINNLHIDKLTKAKLFNKTDIRKINLNEYHRLLKQAYEKDLLLSDKKKINCSAFYALIMCSNFKNAELNFNINKINF